MKSAKVLRELNLEAGDKHREWRWWDELAGKLERAFIAGDWGERGRDGLLRDVELARWGASRRFWELVDLKKRIEETR